jgi:hypothetical protein
MGTTIAVDNPRLSEMICVVLIQKRYGRLGLPADEKTSPNWGEKSTYWQAVSICKLR